MAHHLSLADNVRRHLFRPTGMTTPQFLLQDERKQPANYLAVLLAIAEGHHTQKDIRKSTGLTHIAAYLARLQELHFSPRASGAASPDLCHRPSSQTNDAAEGATI